MNGPKTIGKGARGKTMSKKRRRQAVHEGYVTSKVHPLAPLAVDKLPTPVRLAAYQKLQPVHVVKKDYRRSYDRLVRNLPHHYPHMTQREIHLEAMKHLRDRFADPYAARRLTLAERYKLCSRRKVRREVLFASGKGGKRHRKSQKQGLRIKC